MTKLGLITIGQAPRNDINPILFNYIGNHVNLVQSGALDHMTKEYIDNMFYPEDNDYILTTRLLSGEYVILSREKIEPIIQKKLFELEAQGCRQILLLCTGIFPNLYTKEAFLIEPDKIVPPTVSALVEDKNFGLIVPLDGQKDHLYEKWEKYSLRPYCESISPYQFEYGRLLTVAKRMREKQMDMILMDCIGYDEEMREQLKQLTGVPVILSNSIVAKLTSEIMV